MQQAGRLAEELSLHESRIKQFYDYLVSPFTFHEAVANEIETRRDCDRFALREKKSRGSDGFAEASRGFFREANSIEESSLHGDPQIKAAAHAPEGFAEEAQVRDAAAEGNDSEPFSPVRGEVALWRAVITQALTDALNHSKKSEMRYERNQAAVWLEGRSPDFITVCQHAELDPAYVRQRAKKVLLCGKRLDRIIQAIKERK